MTQIQALPCLESLTLWSTLTSFPAGLTTTVTPPTGLTTTFAQPTGLTTTIAQPTGMTTTACNLAALTGLSTAAHELLAQLTGGVSTAARDLTQLNGITTAAHDLTQPSCSTTADHDLAQPSCSTTAVRDLAQLTSLRLGGLSFPLFLRGSLQVLGQGLVSLELQSIHFPIELELIGHFCPNLQVIWARPKFLACQ